MKKLILILFLLYCISGKAAIYYVSSSDGSDSDSGLTDALAWASLTKVNATTFTAGDQILFKRGDSWYGTLTVKQSGVSGNPITFGAYGTGANPVITGFTTVSAWTNLGGNIWESTSAVSTLSTCNMVAINGVNTAMGRWPNADTVNSGYAVIATNPSTTSITSTALSGQPDYTGGELVLRLSYLIKRKTITSISGTTINYTTSNSAPAGGGFFIQNHPSTLDQQNEWYFNPTTKKIRVYSISQPTDVKVSSLDMNILLNGTNMGYINIDGLTLEGSNAIAMGRSGNGNVGYINVRNCFVRFNGIYGLAAQSNYATLENNTITDSQVIGIWVSSYTNVTVKGNTVINTGMLRGMGDSYMGTDSGISTTNAHYLLCEGNSVTNSGYKGISFYGNYITIKNNFIDTYGVWHDDGGGIYTYTGAGTPMTDCVVDGNIIINGQYPKDGTSNPSFPIMACGIYCDYGTQNVEIKNNSIYKCSSYAMMIGNNQNMNIHHNTIVDDFDAGSTTMNSLIRVNNNEDLPVQGYNINFTYNTFVSLSASVYPIYLTCTQNNLDLIGTIDYNHYIVLDALTDQFYIHQPSTYGDPYMTLAQWKYFDADNNANSQMAPKSIPLASDIEIRYNATASPQQVFFSFAGIDINGTQYASNPTLQPYTSLVLIKNIPNPTGENKAWGENGKIWGKNYLPWGAKP